MGQSENSHPRWKAGKAWPLEHDSETETGFAINIMQRQMIHAATDIPYRNAGEDHANNHEPFGPSTLDIRVCAPTGLSCWRDDTPDGRPRLGRGLCD